MTTTTAPEGEITCLFTDVEGSTTLSKTLQAEEYTRLVEEHNRLLHECFQTHDGNVVDNPGDGFFVTFEHARDALTCAAAVHDSLTRNRERLLTGEKDGKQQYVQVRIGVYKALQEVFLTTGGKYVSREVNWAARVGGCGVGGQIIVNDRAYEAAGQFFPKQWKDHPNRYLRDFDTPQTLHELLWDGRTDRPEPGARWTPKFLLRETNKFVGRDEYLKDIVQWLKGDRPLLLLHGQGGIGKTRLAAQAVLAVGSHFKGRIYGTALDQTFSGAAAQVTPTDLARRIAEAVEAPEEVLNSDNPTDLINHLERRFATEAFLLVLDNFESVSNDATRRFLGELVRRISKIRILVTCRALFQLGALSQSREIDGLKIPTRVDDDIATFEGYQLFCERARQHDPQPKLVDTGSLVRILKATEGVALGIELTAARCLDYSLQRIADGLKQSRLDWQRTATEAGDAPADVARHESIEACIDWSFQLLPEDERRLYPCLSVFPADFNSGAVEEIAGISEEMLLRWSRIHLLQRDRETERCLLQPVLREFAERRLPEEGKGPLHDQFAVYYSAVAAANDEMNSAVQRQALGAELRNLHAAAEYLCARHRDTPDNAGRLNSLGIALWRLPIGVRSENLLKAIACYEAALQVYTQQDFPYQWASTQNNLGTAYSDLPTGDRGINLQKAIACYEAALQVYTQQDFPSDWAMTQNNLGTAYSDLPTGDRGINLQKAIACYEAALQVYTQQDFPTDWANTQNNLGNAYSDLPTGDRGINLQKAIACYEAALQVRTQQDFPTDWAMTQNNLGIAYSDLPTGDRGINLQKAIACYEAALQVYTQQDFPSEWAATQNNLGIAYLYLPTGDRSVNLQKAIACYEAALQVYIQQDFPSDWAGTKNNMGNAYLYLPTGDRGVNLQKAIACYEDALKVYTEEDFPYQWATTQQNIAAALREQGDREGATRALQNAIRGYRMVGMGQEARVVEDLLEQLT